MRIGLNIDGLYEISTLIKKCRIIEKTGFDTIWLGEGPEHRHIYPVLATAASKTEKITIGTSILSVHMHKPFQLFQAFKLLKDVFGNRFIIGIGRGGEKHLASIGKNSFKTISLLEEYLRIYNNSKLNLPIYLGAIGFKTLIKLGDKFNGVIINSISPKIIKTIMEKTKLKNNNILAIGPAAYRPSKKTWNKFLMACAFIASELPDRIALEFEINTQIQEVRSYFFKHNIIELNRIAAFLIENFGIAGSIEDFEKRVSELEKIGVKEVIFSHPISEEARKFNEFTKKIDRLRI
ncbi:MAG: LLM class flavin-dependent oxidoreductase [Candidatus Odinarchaeum yellowstonii]|uniref:LLM class flavin-dependent oxidoreductase n=1 Tax=Odinarchaeota yellowstonii (strain LCB_4) TaxID=1841599 RepID=A0AAF0D130_ODILC|nr:MAG: LLM class flavin-dependent oxidoreductase [Candidatus Odinarchaeum yellowstonii]